MLLTNDGAWAQRVMHPRYGPSASTRSCSIATHADLAHLRSGPTSRTVLHGCSRRGEAGARRDRGRGRRRVRRPQLIIRLEAEARGSTPVPGRRLPRPSAGAHSPDRSASPAPGASATADHGGGHQPRRAPDCPWRFPPRPSRGEAGSGGGGRYVGLGKASAVQPCASAPASSIPGSCTGGDPATLEAGIDPCRCSTGRHAPRADAHPGPRGGSRPWPRFRCDEQRVTIGRRDVTSSPREPRSSAPYRSSAGMPRSGPPCSPSSARRPGRHGDGWSRHRHRRPARRRPQSVPDRIGRDLGATPRSRWAGPTG